MLIDIYCRLQLELLTKHDICRPSRCSSRAGEILIHAKSLRHRELTALAAMAEWSKALDLSQQL